MFMSAIHTPLSQQKMSIILFTPKISPMRPPLFLPQLFVHTPSLLLYLRLLFVDANNDRSCAQTKTAAPLAKHPAIYRTINS